MAEKRDVGDLIKGPVERAKTMYQDQLGAFQQQVPVRRERNPMLEFYKQNRIRTKDFFNLKDIVPKI